MNKIYLDAALSQIKQACDEQKKRGRPSPFFFLVGAGISEPTVPLARQIIEECKEVVEKLGRKAQLSPPASQDTIDVYSYWLQSAFPQRMQRQAYFRDRIEKKPISHANFRLAHLLLDKSVANLVVTPNFDDLLERALTLFGRSPVVCDHPQTVERIYHEQDEDDIRIVHVHGTYWFYDCCNLRGELEGRAQSSQATLTMETLLAKILADRSPLVVGYSGWEGDVIMNALKRNLSSRPSPYNLYWFCYKESEIDGFPGWLKDNPNVFFVIEAKNSDKQSSLDNSESLLVTKNTTEAGRQEEDGKEASEKAEPTLSGQKVFSEMIQAFKLKAPDLTTDPLHFFADSLSNSLPKDNGENAKGSPYFFGSVIERLKKAKANEGEVLTQLEGVRDAVRRSEYLEALALSEKIPIKNLAKPDLIELLEILQQSAPELVKDAVNQKRLYKVVAEMADELSKPEYPKDLPIQKKLQYGLACKAFYLGSEKKFDASIAVCDEMIKRLSKNADQDLRGRLLWAFETKSNHLNLADRQDDRMKTLDEGIEEFSEGTNITEQNYVAQALIYKAARLNALEQYQQSIEMYDEVIKRTSEADDVSLKEKRELAKVNKGEVEKAALVIENTQKQTAADTQAGKTGL